jgi:hypothetical protein
MIPSDTDLSDGYSDQYRAEGMSKSCNGSGNQRQHKNPKCAIRVSYTLSAGSTIPVM